MSSAIFHRGSRRVARALGITAEARAGVVRTLFTREHDEIAAYWLQLGLSIGIATLGLVMGSGAVIIGAMLVAPLMGPIVELALSALVGAGSVMVGAAARVALSVLMAVGLSGAFTLLLPFDEPTGEILARTAPTMLDLFVAICCAVAAAFVTACPSSAATSTAAGTAIGISLVPPLCTVGFGLGTWNVTIAEGALLLFVANLTAILATATLFFWVVGFHPLPSAAFEGREPGHYGFGPLLVRLGKRVDRGIASRFHVLWRLLVPLVLVIAVSVPLERAYQEVAWQVRTRTAIARLVRDTAQLNTAVSLSSIVERHRVAFRAVVVGDEDDASDLTAAVHRFISDQAGVEPLVTITAVPQASATAAPTSMTLMPSVLESPEAAVRNLAEAVSTRLTESWPGGAGRLVSHELAIRSEDAAIRVLALGPGLEPTAVEMLELDLTRLLRRPVHVAASAIPTVELTAPASEGGRWLSEGAPHVALAREVRGLSVCASVPARRSRDASIHAAVDGWVTELGADRVRIEASSSWRLRITEGPCSTASAPSHP